MVKRQHTTGARARGPRARGQGLRAIETPSAPITVRKTVTDIPTLIRLTASDQPDTDRGCLGAAVRLSALGLATDHKQHTEHTLDARDETWLRPDIQAQRNDAADAAKSALMYRGWQGWRG